MRFRRSVLMAVVLGLAACASVESKIFTPVSANRIASSVNIVRHDVIVPSELSVSEANLYYPLVDIVWRDDPPGDRRAQVQKIVEDSLDWGLAAFNRGRPAVVTIEIQRFHALSQKARYSVGGVHELRFSLLVWDASTGSALYGPVDVNADLIALGGNTAIAADAAGQTQKARITQHLAGTVQQQLIAAGLGRQRQGPDEL